MFLKFLPQVVDRDYPRVWIASTGHDDSAARSRPAGINVNRGSSAPPTGSPTCIADGSNSRAPILLARIYKQSARNKVGGRRQVKRRFKASAPNRLCSAALTYVRTSTGWVYVAFIVDVYSRMVVERKSASIPARAKTAPSPLLRRDRTAYALSLRTSVSPSQTSNDPALTLAGPHAVAVPSAALIHA